MVVKNFFIFKSLPCIFLLLQGVDKYEFISADSPVQLTSFCGSRQNTEFSSICRTLEIPLFVKIDVSLLMLRTRKLGKLGTSPVCEIKE